jgi:hypothetical protein
MISTESATGRLARSGEAQADAVPPEDLAAALRLLHRTEDFEELRSSLG